MYNSINLLYIKKLIIVEVISLQIYTFINTFLFLYASSVSELNLYLCIILTTEYWLI